MTNCLFCYQTLEPGLTYHARCCKKFFGTEKLPELALDKVMLDKLAEETVNKRIAITGVQPKLSLDLLTYFLNSWCSASLAATATCT